MTPPDVNANSISEEAEVHRQRAQAYLNNFNGRIEKLKGAYMTLSANVTSQDAIMGLESVFSDIAASSGSFGFPEMADYSAMILKVFSTVKSSSLSFNPKVLELIWQAIKFFEIILVQAKRGKIAIDSSNQVIAKLRSFEYDLAYYRESLSTQRKILIVDDDLDILRLVEIVLKRSGFSVATAKNGYDALTYLQTEMPDLVVLDVAMPGMTGFEVLEKIKSLERTRQIPVMMLTARNNKDEIVRAVQAGAQNYVVKPFDSKELISRIKKLLGE